MISILYMYVIYIAPNARNVTVHINSNIMGKWYNIVRLISKSIFLDLKQKKKNHILIYSSV